MPFAGRVCMKVQLSLFNINNSWFLISFYRRTQILHKNASSNVLAAILLIRQTKKLLGRCRRWFLSCLIFRSINNHRNKKIKWGCSPYRIWVTKKKGKWYSFIKKTPAYFLYLKSNNTYLPSTNLPITRHHLLFKYCENNAKKPRELRQNGKKYAEVLSIPSLRHFSSTIAFTVSCLSQRTV